MRSVKMLFHRGDVTEAPLRRDKNCKFCASSLLKLATISIVSAVNVLFNCKPEALRSNASCRKELQENPIEAEC